MTCQLTAESILCDGSASMQHVIASWPYWIIVITNLINNHMTRFKDTVYSSIVPGKCNLPSQLEMSTGQTNYQSNYAKSVIPKLHYTDKTASHDNW